MSEIHRQHPVAAISYATGTIKDFLVPFVVIVLLGGQADGARTYYIVGAAVIVIGLLFAGFLSWLRYTYRIEDGELKIEYGVFVKKRHFVQSSRIQVINITSGVVQRIFGLVSVEVKTAGESTSEAIISAVTREAAEEIQTLLGKTTRNEEVRDPHTIMRLSKKDQLIAASTAGSFGIALSIIGTITSQLNQFISDTQIYEYLESLELPGTNLIIIMVMAMVIMAWILSLFGTMIKYSGFTLTRNRDELIMARGLFERKQLTIPYSRIQAVRIVQGILRQPFGFATIYVDTAGYGDESGSSTVLFPLIKVDQLEDFIKDNLPDYKVNVSAVIPPARALRRYIIKSIIPALIIIVPVTMLFQFGYISLLLLPLAAGLGVKRFHDAGVGFNDDALVMRFRNLALTTAIVKKRCIQASDMHSIYFQRKRNLVNFLVTVASGRAGAVFRVSELDQDNGNELMTWTSLPSDNDDLTDSTVRLPYW
ncbi:MAG: PH domain-containing protein [Balneolales bacterium]